MKLFIVRTKSCFYDPSKPYHGRAGDAYIGAVIASDDDLTALQIYAMETGYPMDDISAECVGITDTHHNGEILFCAYGLY